MKKSKDFRRALRLSKAKVVDLERQLREKSDKSSFLLEEAITALQKELKNAQAELAKKPTVDVANLTFS